MSRLQRFSLLVALCLTCCQGEDDSDICSTENEVDDIEGAPGAPGQKAVGDADKTSRAPAESASAQGNAAAAQAR